MKSRILWSGDRRFVGQTESGHSIVIGTAHGHSPKPGPSAMEVVLMGAGACSAWDVVDILQKGRLDVEDVAVELDADRAPEPPKTFTRIHMHFVVKGRGLTEAKVARAVNLSVEKYCSATKMLEKSADISHDFEIVEFG